LVRFTHPTRSARVTDVALAVAHRLATGREKISTLEKKIPTSGKFFDGIGIFCLKDRSDVI